MAFGEILSRWNRLRCLMCDVRMKGKKALENYHNDGRYCRTCSQLCELDVHYLVPESERKKRFR